MEKPPGAAQDRVVAALPSSCPLTWSSICVPSQTPVRWVQTPRAACVVARADTLVAWSSLRTLNAQVEAVLSYWSRKRLVVAPSWLTAVYMVAGSASLARRTHAETVKGAVVSRTESVRRTPGCAVEAQFAARPQRRPDRAERA